MKLAIGADHAGWKIKQELIQHLRTAGHDVTDFGTGSDQSVDYPDFAVKVAESVARHDAALGILICGTGIGMSMTANKIPGIRAAAAQSVDAARLSREHNNANVLCLGARLNTPGQITDMVDTWLNAAFQGGRHCRRIDKINALDRRTCCG